MGLTPAAMLRWVPVVTVAPGVPVVTVALGASVGGGLDRLSQQITTSLLLVPQIIPISD